MKPQSALVAILLVSLVALRCGGEQFRTSGDSRVLLASGEIHNGWYFAGSPQVDIDGTVNGDAFIGGGVANVRGTINGMLVVGAGEVNVTGTVTERIICAGGVVRISGHSDKSVFAAGRTVLVERGATVGEYLLAAGSDVQVRGVVERDARIGATDLTLSGQIKGSLEAAVRRFSAEEGSSVGGDLTLIARDSAGVHVPGGSVAGQIHIRTEKESPAPRILGQRPWGIALRILNLLALCATALVLCFVVPRQVASVGTIISGRPGESVLVGLAVLFLCPVLAAVLFVTVIGIPLGILLLFTYLWLAFLSQMSLGIVLGYRLFGFDGKTGLALLGPIVLGIIIVHACLLIPVINVIIFLAGLVAGVGAMTIIIQEQFRFLRSR